MAHEVGNSDYVNSKVFKSLESDYNSDGMNFLEFNPKSDVLYPIVARVNISKQKEVQEYCDNSWSQSRKVYKIAQEWLGKDTGSLCETSRLWLGNYGF